MTTDGARRCLEPPRYDEGATRKPTTHAPFRQRAD